MSDIEAILGAGTVNWRYVPSESSPADDITRRLRSSQLSVGHRYNDGPNLLYEVEELWPENKVQAPCEKDNESEKRKDGLEHPRQTKFCWGGRSIRH